VHKWPLVEICCGRGIFLNIYGTKGLTVWGANWRPPRFRIVSAMSCATGPIFIDLPAELRARARGALLCEVIEHLPDPVAFLRKV
jgi:hypothetical protein